MLSLPLPEHQEFFALATGNGSRDAVQDQSEVVFKTIEQLLTRCAKRRAGFGLDVVEDAEKETARLQEVCGRFDIAVPVIRIDRADPGDGPP